jgi:hypothetical protein
MNRSDRTLKRVMLMNGIFSLEKDYQISWPSAERMSVISDQESGSKAEENPGPTLA